MTGGTMMQLVQAERDQCSATRHVGDVDKSPEINRCTTMQYIVRVRDSVELIRDLVWF